MTNETIQKLINLVNRYDKFTCYIDDYHQEQKAIKRNERIEAEFIETATTIGINVSGMDFDDIIRNTGTTYSKITIEEAIEKLLQEKGYYNKEDNIMKNTNTSATINNTIIKEENVMTKKERIQDVARRIEQFTKTSDEGYVTKEEMAELIFDCMGEAKPNIKKYKRAQLIEAVMIIAGNKPQDSVSVEDENTHDDTPAQEDNLNDAKAKTDALLGLLKNYAAYNENKGYGYTISSFMLQACILEAGAGVKKFKGHTITPEESKMTHDVYHWLKDKGFILPVVYSVVEDPNVRVYLDGYKGRTDSTKTKMIPYNKSNGYTAKQVTSFVVTLR